MNALTQAAQDGAKLTQDGHVDLSPYRYCLSVYEGGKITVYHIRTLQRLNARIRQLEWARAFYSVAERVKP